jgi:hypothetical protein
MLVVRFSGTRAAVKHLTNRRETHKSHILLRSTCRLGGVVVSVLATGPKRRGFEPGQGDGF